MKSTKNKLLLLSKSDFKVASTCAKKLKYKKMAYPSNMEENEFLKMLAEGGYMIGKMATLLYRGIEITGTTNEAVAKTKELLQEENVVLHEAAIQSGQKLIRIDILEKTGNHFRLIEVKAKSFNSEEDESSEKKNMVEYIEDVVFQTYVLQEAYPHARIDSFLLMPDKSKQTKIEGLAGWFKVKPEPQRSRKPGEFRKVEVEFIYEDTPQFDSKRQQLIEDNLLELMDLNEEVEKRKMEVVKRASNFLELLNTDFNYQSHHYKIDKSCKGCEYQANEEEGPNGFKECWGKLASVAPHIFDLHYGGAIGHYKAGYYFDELIDQKKVSLFDIDLERLKNKKGEIGTRAQRQLIQINHTKSGTEWFSSLLQSELQDWKYPLHFIDFETYTGAIPFHKGMRPYEVVAFQWSCHTISAPGKPPIHSEWINTEESFPNFRFAESLMKQIGSNGTPLMWATHENTVLRKILSQMNDRGYTNSTLQNWLTDITHDREEGRTGRLVDMNAFTIRNFFHPYMKGRTSIKKVLPAVWNHNPSLHEVPWFKPYHKIDENGRVLDPYQTLKYLFAANTPEAEMAIMELEEVVNEGSAAMKAYFDMMYGQPDRREYIQQQLLEYCKLDTLAMVIIWFYWSKLTI